MHPPEKLILTIKFLRTYDRKCHREDGTYLLVEPSEPCINHHLAGDYSILFLFLEAEFFLISCEAEPLDLGSQAEPGNQLFGITTNFRSQVFGND
jgi:hypothetical protein